ncbi:MAG: DUF4886 domain-containing protein, partial [Clostridiales bacterium]|nr:DUF4886 domain-containing protein [Clostridiales bacterium]
LRRSLAALLALILVLGTYPAVGVAASLDEADISAASQEEETETQAEENAETTEGIASDNSTAEETADTETEQTEVEVPTEEMETAPAEEETETTEETETAPVEEEEETGEEVEADEAQAEVSAASTTRTAAYKRSYAKKGTTFRILVIGNSFSVGSTEYLYQVASDAGYAVVVGNLSKKDKGLDDHWGYAKNDSAVYTYRKNSTGTWKTIGETSVTMTTAVEDEAWDLIIFQQHSIDSGLSSSFYSSAGDNYLTLLSNYVTKLCSNSKVKIGFEMTWAHRSDSGNSVYKSTFGGSQLTMYKYICSTTKSAVAASGAVDLIVTTGTAIQNARSSYMGDTLNRDAKHLSYGLGRWLAAMSLASACGMDLSGVTAINSDDDYGSYSSLHLEVLKQAIADAEKTPYAVTAQDSESPTLSNPKVTTSTSGTKLTLTWSAVTGATGYEVYQLATSGSDYTLVKTLSTGKSSYSYTGNINYGYYVCALGDDYVAATASNTVGTFGSIALARPSISSVSNARSGGLTVKWSTVTGATGYQVQTATDSSFTQNVQTTTSTGASKTTSSRTSGTKYYVRVRAYKTASGTKNYSAWSSKKSIYCVAAPPLSSVKNTSSGVKITWEKISGVSGYIVYRKNSSGNYVKIKTISGSGTVSYTDDNATTNGKKYSYKVKAYKTVSGTTYKSAASSAKSTYRLTSPTISSMTNSASKKMTVKWDKNSKATGYQIQYSTSSDFSSYKTVTISSYKTVSKTISSLTKGKKYYVRVRAYKTVSGTKYYSAWSSKKSVKISK